VIAALAALALVGASSTHSEAPPLEVLEAGEAEYDVARERGSARGGVVLRRGVVVLLVLGVPVEADAARTAGDDDSLIPIDGHCHCS
jgi:hypothetical protein